MTYNIFKWRMFFIAVIASISIAAIFSMIVGKFKTGVDFAGGSMIEFTVPENIKMQYIREVVDQYGDIGATLQSVSNNTYIIRASGGKLNNISDISIGDYIKDTILAPKIEGISFDRIESISGHVTSDLIKQSVTGVIFAIVSIIMYLIIRFHWKFAFTGIIVLLLDVVMALGLISIYNIEMNLTIIAAILTILGYCINDIVVIYDRIRSNMQNTIGKTDEAVVSRSVNETFRRSVVTSFVTLISVFGIIFFTNIAIRNFAIVVGFGIIVGTISSIFLAPSLLLLTGVPRFRQHIDLQKDPMFYNS